MGTQSARNTTPGGGLCTRASGDAQADSEAETARERTKRRERDTQGTSHPVDRATQGSTSRSGQPTCGEA